MLDSESPQLVWAPYKNHEGWPAKLVLKGALIKPKGESDFKEAGPDSHYVLVFGSNTVLKVPKGRVYKYIDFVHEYSKGNGRKSRYFQAALNYIHEQHWCLLELRGDPASGYNAHVEDQKELKEEAARAEKAGCHNTVKKGRKRAVRKPTLLNQSVDEDFSNYVPFSKDDSDLPSYTVDENNFVKINQKNEPCPLFNTRDYECLDRPTFPKHVRRKCKTCGELEFGFIGIGKANRTIIEQILTKRHKVNIWTKFSFKYDTFMRIGARRNHTPEQLIVSSDVIFCTMPDEDVSPHFIYAKSGLYDGLIKSKPKIYVSVTTINQAPDQEIRKAVLNLHFSYFEVKLIEYKDENGTNLKPIFLCAGDVKVFRKIRPYLEHVSKHIHYFGTNFGRKPSVGFIPYCISSTLSDYPASKALEILNELGYKIDLSNVQEVHCSCEAAIHAMESLNM